MNTKSKYSSISQILENCSIETEEKWNNLIPNDIENIINEMLFETVSMKKNKVINEIINLNNVNYKKEYFTKIMIKQGWSRSGKYNSRGFEKGTHFTTTYRNVFSSELIQYYTDNRDSYCSFIKFRPKCGIEIMRNNHYYKKISVKELKQSCKDNKLKKYSRLRKNELIQLLMTI